MYTVKTKDKGRAMYSERPYCAGDLIEETDVILVPHKEIPDDNVLAFYAFQWDANTLAISLGKSSLFNNSKQPNVAWTLDKDRVKIRFFALCDIAANKELTINYGYEDMLPTDKAAFARGEIYA